MALTGLDIYKLLPKTNCKDCGFATCLAFAMALAQKKVSLDKCPHVTAQAREALESASQPPIRLVTIGTGEKRIEMGNETVMYRHEQKFFHPAAIGILIEDTLDEDTIARKISEINVLKFERVGRSLGVDLICVKNTSGYKNKFINAARKVAASSEHNMALYSSDVSTISEAINLFKAKRPLIICDDANKAEPFIKLAKASGLPLAIGCASLEEAAEVSDKAKKIGFEDIIINLKAKGLARRIQDLTLARRTALKKNFRPLGFPMMVITDSENAELELTEAVTYVLKYASLVIIKNIGRELVFPLLVTRQDIYQDPQKPVQVEPRIYEVGKVTDNSPVLITTNFSITYFTVAGEVESSKIPSFIISCDSEGMSVLTAWAAEKFTAEKITDTLKKSGIEAMVSHRNIVIPGYVSVMSGRLEELSGWKVSVGPREASGIPNYLKAWK